MSRINIVFKKNKVFVAYLTAGQKGLDYSFQAALTLIESGVDLLEIGVPFSDPIADGPVIQNAMKDALVRKVTILDTLKLIKKIRKYSAIPIVLFGYFNPILQAGYKNIFKRAKAAGVDGFLIVDLPLEESAEYLANCNTYNISPIFVIAPSTNLERIKQINKKAKGFFYYACRTGTTGMRDNLPSDFNRQIKLIKQNTNLPVVVGFGVSSCQVAKKIIATADGFVVGSLFIDAINKGIAASGLKKIAINIDPRKRR
ncbi:Tryptophan synthase alpha chain [Gammaproteobacteria bacterium]